MNILFDHYGAQAMAQEATGDRFTGLIDAITSADYTWSIAPGRLDSSVLSGVDVLVLTSRTVKPYNDDEITALTSFVTNGGGVWCMANHAGFNAGSLLDNFVKYTGTIANMYWTAYEPAAYDIPGHAVEVPITGSNLADHPTITGQTGWPLAPGSNSVTVSEVVTRSFCAVYPNSFTDPVCNLDNMPTVVNTQTNAGLTPGVVWALALDSQPQVGSGRMIICGDSGWIGDTTSNYPGPGEFQNGDNAQYALNTLTWLGGN